ncbi:MAG: DUF1376 domain-containing protein [Pseudomonadota bacterium]
MSDTPFVNWCPSDWLAATRHLSLEERAVYHDLLMMLYEQYGSLKADWTRIGRLIGVRPGKLKQIVETLAEEGKIVVADGMITNARVEKELAKREKKSEAAAASAKARWAKDRKKRGKNGEKTRVDQNTPAEPKTDFRSEKSNKNNEADMRSQCGRNASEHANQNHNHIDTAAATRARAQDDDPIETAEGANPHLDADAGPPRDADSPSSAPPGPPEDADSSPGQDPGPPKAAMPSSGEDRQALKDRITDLLDRVLEAANVDLSKDISGKWHSSEARYAVQRWIDLGLTDEEILGKIREIIRRRQGAPPNTLQFFNPAMCELAGKKHAPALQPTPPNNGGTNGSGSERLTAGESRAQRKATRDVGIATKLSERFPGG